MASTYTPIATNTLTSATSTVTFSSIPATYTDLILIVTATSASGGTQDVGIRFNNDSGSNYSRIRLNGNGSAASTGRNQAVTVGYGLITTTTAPTVGTVQINSYSNSSTYKNFLYRASEASDSAALGVVSWASTAAINRIDVLGMSYNFAIGSTFTIYGIKAA